MVARVVTKPMGLLIPLILAIFVVACEIPTEQAPTQEPLPAEEGTPVVAVAPEATSISAGAELISSATTLLESGDLGAAEALLEDSLAAEPNNPAALHKLGFALLGQERYDEAIEVFNQELAVDPDFPDAWLGLALALAGSNRRGEALEALSTVLSLDPANADALQARQALEGGP